MINILKQTNKISRSNIQVGMSIIVFTLLLCSSISICRADEFILVPGDELHVFIPGTTPAHRMLTIDMKGEIDLGINGRLKIAGVSLKKSTGLLKSHLSRYLRSTVGVTVMLNASRRTILITGQVRTPGLVTIEETTDLWQAVSQAGGLAPGADLSRVLVVRNEIEIPVDLRAYLTRDSSAPLPVLRAGDTVFIPGDPSMSVVEAGATAFLGNAALERKVFVVGAVANPGLYDRSDTLSVLTAVTLAGGPLSDSDLGNVHMLTQNKNVVIDLNKVMKGKSQGRKLLPEKGGTIIFVPFLTRGIDSRLGQHINVIGGVRNPGRIPISSPVRLVDAIGLAGGPENEAKLRHVHVIRDEAGFTLASEFDVKRYFKHGGPVGRMFVHAGTTIYLGTRNLDALNTTIAIIGTLATISTTAALWITLSRTNDALANGTQ